MQTHPDYTDFQHLLYSQSSHKDFSHRCLLSTVDPTMPWNRMMCSSNGPSVVRNVGVVSRMMSGMVPTASITTTQYSTYSLS